MNRFLLLFFWLVFPFYLSAQNCGLEQAVAIPFTDTLKIDLEVFDVVNDDLADAGQAVCNIDVGFISNEINGLEMWLVSPNQDTVQLIGPKVPGNGFGTLGSRWDVRFLNDSINATASPDFPYDQFFDNRINNFLANNYSGSYFPNEGSLRDFNTGPVNGTWQLIAHFEPTVFLVEGSQVYSVQINFCDARGYNCCFANAGSLRNIASQDACEGSPELQFNTVPIFDDREADSSIYDYTFAIGRDSILYAFDSIPDFSSYAPGTYQLCGLSYQSDQRDSFPAIDGLFRLDTFANQLRSEFPPFCGELTDTCITIVIRPTADTTFLGTRLLCGADSLVIAGQTLDSTGVYFIEATNAAGCDSIIQVDLNVQPIQRDTLLETACVGAIHTSATGTVLDTTGYYPFTYTSSLTGCDSIVVIDFRRLEINPQVIPSGTDLSCSIPSITLDASTSTANFGTLSYRWEIPPFGEIVGTDSVLTVTEPGDYFLQIETQLGNNSCARRVNPISITSSALLPNVTITSPASITCIDTVITLQANVNPIGNYSYQWSTNNGSILNGADGATPQVNTAGDYQLIVTNLDTGCPDTTFIQVPLDTIRPQLMGVHDTVLTCDPGNLRLNVQAVNPSDSYTYQWSAQSGRAITDADTASPLIDFADTFIVSFTNTNNGCQNQDSLIVSLDTLTPSAEIQPVPLLDCQLREFDLDARISDQSPSLQFEWQTSNGANISANSNSLQPTINAAGTYTLSVRDTLNGCSSQTSVTVTDTSEVLFAEIMQPIDISCSNPSVFLNPGNSSRGPNISYTWTDLDQGIFSSVEADSISISQGGRYQLVVQNTFTNCLAVANFVASVDTLSPAIDAGPNQELTCSQPVVTLTGTPDPSNAPTEYIWLGPCITSAADQTSINVDCEGAYIYQATNLSNGCITTDTAIVSTNPTTPRVVITDTFQLDCSTGEVFLDASQSSGGRVEWFFNGLAIGAVNDIIRVSRTGTYTVRVINDTLACSSEKDVEVVLDCTPSIVLNDVATLNCQNDSILLDANGSLGESLSFSWLGPNGCIIGNDTMPAIYVDCPGTYQLIVSNTFFNQSDTLLVEVQEDINFPLIDLGPDLTLTCFNPNIQLDASNPANDTGLVYSWKTEFGLTFADTSVLTIDTRGTYILEIENPRNFCSSSDTIFIQGIETPVFEIRAPETITCADSVIELSAFIFSDTNNLDYNWTSLTGQVINNSNLPTITTEEAGDYVLTLSNPNNGCATSDTISVNINQTLPQISAGEDQVLNCDINQITLTGNAITQSNDREIRWLAAESDDFVSDSEALSVVVQDTGLFQFLVVDLENGCAAVDTVQVLPPPPLPALPTLPDTSLSCALNSINLDAGFARQDSFNFSWKGITDQGQAIARQNGSLLEVDAPGFYTFEIENTFTACIDSLSVRVNDNTNAPDFTIASPATLTCLKTEVLLNLAFPLDPNRYELLWEGQQISANGDSLLVTAPGFYNLTVTDRSNGCARTDRILVNQSIEVPSITLPSPGILTCLNDTLTLNANAALNTLPVWSGPAGGIIGDSTSFDIQIRLPGTYVLSVTDTVTGCSNGDALMIADGRIAPSLNLDTSQLILGCDNPVLTVDASNVTTASGAAPIYNWTGINIASNAPSISVNLAQVISLNIQDPGNGCAMDFSIPIRQDQELPQFQLSTDGPLGCGKSESLLEAQFLNFSPNFELAWKDETNNTIGTQANLRVNQTGTYRLVVTNPANMCSSEQTIMVSLNDQTPIINLAVDTILDCNINEVLVAANSSNYNLSDLELSWSTTNGQILENLPNGSISVGEAGLYTVNAFNLSNNCEQTATINVMRRGRTINSADILLRQNTCSETGAGSLLVNQIIGGDAPFLYAFNDQGFQSNNGFNFQQAGAYKIRIQDINGCEWDSLINVSPLDLPEIDLGADIEIIAGDSTTLDADIDPNDFIQLEWISNNAILASNTNNLMVKPNISSAYTLRGTTLDGCSFEDVIQVFVREAPVAYLPTAFSPNEDGVNDVFLPGFSDQVVEIERFNIFDRWGNMLFQSTQRAPDDLDAGWDGNINNQSAASGVYTFWIEVRLATGEMRSLQGEVLLIR